MSEMSEDTTLETQNYKVFSNVVYHYLCKKCGRFADSASGSNDYPHQCGLSKNVKFAEKPPEKKVPKPVSRKAPRVTIHDTRCTIHDSGTAKQ